MDRPAPFPAERRRPLWSVATLLGLMLTAGTASGVECLDDAFSSTPSPWPDYAAADPAMLASCAGTNHQTIDVVDRVVFIGDTVVVGTPPTAPTQFFRSLLADQLVAQYGLAAPSAFWKNVDPINGLALIQDSGDFSSCAKWGSRTDDLLAGDMQIADCFPALTLSQRTLVVIMTGAADFGLLATAEAEGATPAELQASLEDAMNELRSAIEWLLTPGRYPYGVFVVLANPLEFTDLTGDGSNCAAWAGAGFTSFAPVLDLITDGNEEILDIVVDNQVDLVFARERFCGHGWNAADPAAPCYRGPGQANWFDASCSQPNPTGHAELASDFFEVIVTPAPTPVPSLTPGMMGVLVVLGAGAMVVWRRH